MIRTSGQSGHPRAVSLHQQAIFLLSLCAALFASGCSQEEPVGGDLWPPAVSKKFAGGTFSVLQAESAWMPGHSNLRWNVDSLESLFFVEIEADISLSDLTVVVETGDDVITIPVSNVRPLTEEDTKRIEAADAAWFSIDTDIIAQQRASKRTVKELWLPVAPGKSIRFSLKKADRLLAALPVKTAIDGDCWSQLNLAGGVANPLDYGYALFPKSKMLTEKGVAIEVELSAVALDSRIKEISLVVLLEAVDGPPKAKLQVEGSLDVAFLQWHVWKGRLPTEDLAPGKYSLIALVSSADGRALEKLQKEIVVIEPEFVKRRFGATYADLSYESPSLNDDRARWHDTHFGPFTDIVVAFDGTPHRIVFSHRDHAYVPIWFINDVGFDWGWMEATEMTSEGGRSLEPIQDRECRYSRASIVHSTPARAIVHWRYAESSSHRTGVPYRIVDEEWVDEYYYFYPDFVGVRKVMGWFLKDKWHEANEFIVHLPAGMHPREAMEAEYVSIVDLDGNELNLDGLNTWKNWSDRWNRFSEKKDDFVLRLNIQGRPRPFVSVKQLTRFYSLWSGLTYGPVPRKEMPWGAGFITKPHQLDARRNSWCLFDFQYVPVEIRELPGGRRFSEEEIQAQVNLRPWQKDLPNDRVLSVWSHLIGIDEQIDPVAMTRSWLSPAQVVPQDGLIYVGHEATERSFKFQGMGANAYSFGLSPHPGADQINPVIEIAQVKEAGSVEVSMDGTKLSSTDFKYGFEPQFDGSFTLVIWLNKTINTPTQINITKVSGPFLVE